MSIVHNATRATHQPGDMAELLIGETPVMQQLRALVARVAPSSLPVLIQGPTGAGKELVAEALHRWSGRQGNLVAFNVCALGDSMFEDAVFGHVKGAFTGALREAPGYLVEADRGTVFLDEIGGLPLAAQAKLLRAVETRQFRPVGASYDRTSEFRLVAASNERLDALVGDGRFRPDLAFRLRGVVVEVPSLSARRADIPLLARSFLEKSAPGVGLELGSDALGELMAQGWEGNVRELKHVVERAVLNSTGRKVTRGDVRMALPLRAPADRDPAASLARRRMVNLLAAHDWDTAKVASTLGVHRATVYRQMKRLGLDGPMEGPEALSDVRNGTSLRTS